LTVCEFQFVHNYCVYVPIIKPHSYEWGSYVTVI